MDEHGHPDEEHGLVSWWELWPMLGWGAYTVYLYATGQIFYLLRPVYGHIAFGGALVLLAAFVYGWLLRRRGLRHRAEAAMEAEADHEHDHHHDDDSHDGGCACGRPRRGVGRYVRSLVFILPLLVGFALPEHGPNSLAAIQWGAGDLALAAQQAEQHEVDLAQRERGYAWVTVAGAAQCLQAQRVEKLGTMGLVVHMDYLPGDQFLLVRFTMNCCAACAQPIVCPVRWADAATLKNNQWIKVFGTTDPQAKVLVAEEVELTKEPKNPYL